MRHASHLLCGERLTALHLSDIVSPYDKNSAKIARKLIDQADNAQRQKHFEGDDMRITAVTCVKNEGPFLLEWIAFNRLIGVTDFLFYSNDCSDATDRLLDALQVRGIVQHLPNPAEGRNYQMEALKVVCPH